MENVIIGITGGIASGKSTITKKLVKITGYPAYDTDTEAKRLIVEDQELRAAISSILGPDVYEGNIYRRDIASKRLFGSKDLLSKVNEATIPCIRRDIKRFISESSSKCVIVECAILFESGLNTLCDKVICVCAPEELRVKRTMERSGLSEEETRARISAQMAEEDRNRLADVIIRNDETTTEKQLEDICINTLREMDLMRTGK